MITVKVFISKGIKINALVCDDDKSKRKGIMEICYSNYYYF